MLSLISNWLLSAALIFLTSRLFESFQIPDFTMAMIMSLFIGLVNITIRPLLKSLEIPPNLLSLGLFTFAINAVILKLADNLLTSLQVSGWRPVLLVALFLVLIQELVYLVRSRRSYQAFGV